MRQQLLRYHKYFGTCTHRRHPHHCHQEPSEEWRWKHDQEQHQRLSYLLRLVDLVSEQIGNEVVLFADLLKIKKITMFLETNDKQQFSHTKYIMNVSHNGFHSHSIQQTINIFIL